MLSIPEKDAMSHEQANRLGASLEAGLEMYKQLQNTYLTEPQGQGATLNTKQRRYVNLERPQPPPRVASKPLGGKGGKATTLSREELVQGEYEVEEEEGGEDNNGYSVLNGSD